MEPRQRGIIYWLCATLFVLLWTAPITATLLTSVKTLDELNQGKYWTWPEQINWHNYYEAFIEGGFSRYFLNSLIITIPSVLFILFLSSLNGYALAKLRFKGRESLVLTFVGGMLLPFQILLIPVFYISSRILNVYDTHLGVILFHVAFQVGFGSFFMRNFIKALPNGLIEAARIDGASEWNIFMYTIVPLMRPALAALSTLMFTWIWNDFLWSLILLQSDSLKPITVALQNLKGQWVASYHLQSAGAVIAAIPPIAIFSLLQKHFIRGLTMGSVR
jgi:multiple sugar transport system permease protein